MSDEKKKKPVATKKKKDDEDGPEPKKSKKAPAAKKAAPGPISRSLTPRLTTTADKTLRVLSVNVAGLRSVLDEEKGAARRAALIAMINKEEPHVLCINEHKLKADDVKAAEAKLDELLPRYKARFWSCSEKPARLGYSGVAMFVRDDAPDGLVKAVCEPGMDGVAAAHKCEIVGHEGRLLTLHHASMTVVSVYVPNSGQDLKRLDYRVKQWDTMLAEYVTHLEKKRGLPVLLIGDMNCAHGPLDIHNMYARPNLEELCNEAIEDQYVGLSAIKKQAGLTAEERTSFTSLLGTTKLVDTFRAQHPTATGVFSYYSQRAVQNRPNNRGLRLDYVLASESLTVKDASPRVVDSFILDEGDLIADHAAVGATILL